MKKAMEVTISGAHYSMNPYAPSRGLELFGRLVEFAGPALAPIAVAANTGGKTKDEIKKQVLEALPNAVMHLAPKMGKPEVMELIYDLLHGLHTPGGELTRQNFDSVFAGRTPAILTLLGKVVVYQFADFLSAYTAGESTR